MSMQFVECMLEIHSKYSELVQSVFNADQQFYGALDKVTMSRVCYSLIVSHCISIFFVVS